MSAEAFRRDVLAGLAQSPRRVPATYLWDDAGAALFDRVCEGPDYHVTRTETALLAAHAGAIAASVGPGATVVEFGSGASRKVRLLLDALEAPAGYVPVDIAPETLRAAASRIASDYPELRVEAVAGDYTAGLRLPGRLGEGETLGFYPGHTIGTYRSDELALVLAHLRESLGGGFLLVGVDPTVDGDFLRRAYGDPEGRMAAFHLHLLERMRDELDSDVQPGDFRHEACVFDDPARVEAHLVAVRDTQFRIGDQTVAFGAGESLLTDHSFKYPPAAFEAVAREAGWGPVSVFVAEDGRFSLHLLRG